MASVVGPLSSWGASGKHGPTAVHGNWRGTSVVRSTCVARNPRSDLQQKIRGQVSDLARAWGELSADDAETWRAYSRVHLLPGSFTEFEPTALNCYIRLNQTRVDNGLTALSTAPTVVYLGDISDVWANSQYAPGTVYAHWTVPVGATADAWVRVELAGPHDHGNYNPQLNEYRVIDWKDGDSTGNPYFGYEASKWYWVRVGWFDEYGQRGAFEVASTITLPG